MAGTLGFLFNGQAPAPTTTGQTSTSSTPTWMQQYIQGLIAQANSVASTPYQAFPGPQVAGFTPQQTQAQSEIGALQGAQNGTLSQATSLAGSSANPGAISQGLGMLPTAATNIQNSIAPTAAQINPYEQNVINKAEADATQYWQNQLQPSINNQFTAAGQYGSSANQRAEEQGANQITQNIQNTANAALASGYQNAQQANLAAGQAQGALGQTYGGLGYEQGVLGEQGASTLGSLASTGQNLGLQGASALDTIGGEQQSLNQANLNAAYQNFQNQVQYPEQQLSWLTGIESGAPSSGASTATTQTGFAPSYSASPLSQAIGMYTALNPTTPAKRGGSIRRRTRTRSRKAA
jgi:hypothetical protein